jgi:putative chitinase
MKLPELNPQQLANAKLIDTALVEMKLSNPFLRAGILAVVSKESGFIPQSEIGYAHTDNSVIRRVFGWLFNGWTDERINALKKSDVDFFNYVYGPLRTELGNTKPGDGYRFRGQGFHQLTTRPGFQKTGEGINVDLIAHPEKMLEPETAAKALAFGFRSAIVSAQWSGKFLRQYGIVTTSQIAKIEIGAHVAHWANAGFGIKPENDPTKAYAIALADAPSYLQMTQK